MFEQIGQKSFLNREHTGEYAEVEFDTYIDNRGAEEVIDVVTPMHYYNKGKGAPLILVHGIGQTTYTWRKVFNELAEHYNVYAIDLPGHGFSGKPEIAYSVEEVALSIEAFMNAMQIKDASFVAFAESAVYVMDFAIHNPDRAGGIVLISPSITSGGNLLRGHGIHSALGALAGRMNPQIVKNQLQECYFDQTLITDKVVEEYIIGIADREYKQIAKLYMSNFSDDEALSSLHLVKSPLLVIVGVEDKITGGKNSPFLDLGFEHGSFLAIRNCGFLPQEEKPEKTVEAIKTFLKA